MAQNKMGSSLDAMKRGIGMGSRDWGEEGSTALSCHFEPLGTVGAVDRIGVDFSDIAGGSGEAGEAPDKELQVVRQFFLKKDQRRGIEIMLDQTDHRHELKIISTP